MTESQKERVHAQTQQMYSEAIVINAMEEMAELIQALCKTLRLMLGDKTLWRDETSQLLQDAGFEDASKYLDAAWEL